MAFIAGADDLTALFYNPAALTRIRRNNITLNVAGVQQFVNFQRAQTTGAGPLNDDGVGSDIAFPRIENNAPAFVIPYFGDSSRLGTKNTTFAFGFYPPYAPDLSYDADGPQRYSLIDVMVIQIMAGSEGLNLQHFKEIYFVSAGWNPSIEDQAVARCHRMGQEDTVNVFRFEMEPLSGEGMTLDRYCGWTQDKKRELFQQLE